MYMDNQRKSQLSYRNHENIRIVLTDLNGYVKLYYSPFIYQYSSDIMGLYNVFLSC